MNIRGLLNAPYSDVMERDAQVPDSVENWTPEDYAVAAIARARERYRDEQISNQERYALELDAVERYEAVMAVEKLVKSNPHIGYVRETFPCKCEHADHDNDGKGKRFDGLQHEYGFRSHRLHGYVKAVSGNVCITCAEHHLADYLA